MTREPENSATAAAFPAFFSRLFDEALALAEEARTYFAGPGRDDSAALPPVEAMVFCYEANLVTARVGHVMAWLLVRRAVQSGELDQIQARARQYRLGDSRICLDRDEVTAGDLPEVLTELMTKSENLYRRVSRLERLVSQGRA